MGIKSVTLRLRPAAVPMAAAVTHPPNCRPGGRDLPRAAIRGRSGERSCPGIGNARSAQSPRQTSIASPDGAQRRSGGQGAHVEIAPGDSGPRIKSGEAMEGGPGKHRWYVSCAPVVRGGIVGVYRARRWAGGAWRLWISPGFRRARRTTPPLPPPKGRGILAAPDFPALCPTLHCFPGHPPLLPRTTLSAGPPSIASPDGAEQPAPDPIRGRSGGQSRPAQPHPIASPDHPPVLPRTERSDDPGARATGKTFRVAPGPRIKSGEASLVCKVRAGGPGKHRWYVSCAPVVRGGNIRLFRHRRTGGVCSLRRLSAALGGKSGAAWLKG